MARRSGPPGHLCRTTPGPRRLRFGLPVFLLISTGSAVISLLAADSSDIGPSENPGPAASVKCPAAGETLLRERPKADFTSMLTAPPARPSLRAMMTPAL